MTGFWDAGKVDLLKRMVQQGHTAGQMANELGCSRNAVIGKCLRMKLPLAGASGSVSPLTLAQRAERRRLREQAARAAAGSGAGVSVGQRVTARRDQMEAARRTGSVLAAVAGSAAPGAPVGFLAAVDADLCLFFAGDPLGAAGTEMPVCGNPRDPAAPHDNRYCAFHRARLAGAGIAEHRAWQEGQGRQEQERAA